MLLDTNIVIDFFKGNQHILNVFQQQSSLFIAVPVLGELLLGAFRSVNSMTKRKEIEYLLSKCSVLHSDNMTAERYASVKSALLQKGRPIPDNDIWIAATALQHNLPLFTSDAHFREVDGLQLFNPLTSV